MRFIFFSLRQLLYRVRDIRFGGGAQSSKNILTGSELAEHDWIAPEDVVFFFV